MATKKVFTFTTPNNEKLEVQLYRTSASFGHYQNAKATVNGQSIHSMYGVQMRAWEDFEFESVLRRFINKAFKGNDTLIEHYKNQLKEHAKREREASEKWFSAFKKRYDNLSDKTKKHLANACPVITSEKQAEDIMDLSEKFDVMFKLMGD